MNKIWADNDNKILKKLWGSGATAREIGVTLKRTRGSVIGRANRIGLSTPAPKRVVRETAAPIKSTNKCQFPIGTYPYRFCGKQTHNGASTDAYCAKHYSIAYRERIGTSDKFKVEENEVFDASVGRFILKTRFR